LFKSKICLRWCISTPALGVPGYVTCPIQSYILPTVQNYRRLINVDDKCAIEYSTLQVGEHQLVVVSTGQQIIGARRESQRTHVGRVRLETLQAPGTPDVVQDARQVLVAADQQSPGRFHADGGHRWSLLYNIIHKTESVKRW